MVRVLSEWFGALPTPEKFTVINRTHLRAAVVQDWAPGDGVKWVLNTN